MADCVSLPNATELVVELKCFHTLLDDYAEANVPYTRSELDCIVQAADAIEQLVAENAKLKERCELLQGNNVLLRGCVDKYNIDEVERLREENAKLKAERDAAVADLTSVVHDMCGTCICDYCVGCNKNRHFDECKTSDGDRWEWRGIKEEEDADD